MTGQRYKVYLNRNVHKTVDDYLRYLSTSLNVPDPQTLLLVKEISVGSGKYMEILDALEIMNNIELVLTRKGKLVKYPQGYLMKPLPAQQMRPI